MYRKYTINICFDFFIDFFILTRFQKCIIQKVATSPSDFKCYNPLKTAYREKQEIHTTRNKISCVQITKDVYGRIMLRKPSF